MPDTNRRITRRTLLISIGAAGAVTVLPRRAQAAKIILKVASNQSGDENSVNWGWKRFGEAVAKRLPGVIDYQFYPAGQLGGDKAFLEGLRLGTIQMAGIGQVGQVAPRVGLLRLPH